MEQLPEAVAHAAIESGLPFIKSGPNGEIYAANPAFCEMTGYTEYELQRIGWVQLSVRNEDLLADQATLQNLIAGNILSYSVIKSYVTKGGIPVAGQMTAVRWPQGKESLEYCLCWFVPFVNGSKAALTMVTNYIEQHTHTSNLLTEAITAMNTAVQENKAKTAAQRLWDAAYEWAAQNPKTAGSILLFVLLLNPRDTVIEIMRQKGWIPAPPVQIEMREPVTGKTAPLTPDGLRELQYAMQHARADVEERAE